MRFVSKLIAKRIEYFPLCFALLVSALSQPVVHAALWAVMSQTTRREEIPISADGIRKDIQRTILTVEKETDLFIHEHPGDVGNHGNWMKFISAACGLMQTDPNSLRDYNDLRPILSKARSHESLSEYREEYLDLRRMTERAKLFDFIAFDLREELMNVYETKLEKFCLSFYQETKEEELKSVEEYEETIRICRREIKDRRELVDRLVEEAGRHKDSLRRYIDNYPSIMNRMIDVCQALAGVCIPMKKWLSADANYTHRIQEEVTNYTRRKLDLQEVIKEKAEEREKWNKRVRRAAGRTRSLESKLKEFKEEKMTYMRRKADVEQRFIKCEAELNRRQSDLREIKEEEEGGGGEGDGGYLSGMADAVSNDIRWTEEKLNRMMDQMKGLQLDERKIQGQIDLVSESIEDNQSHQKTAAERRKTCDEEIGYVNEDIRFHLSKIRALQKVREVKLHSDTLKKIFHYGYNPELIIDNKGRTKVTKHNENSYITAIQLRSANAVK